MTPQDFIAKWQSAHAKERSASQEHFLDLCRLLDEPSPNSADPQAVTYCFEKGINKVGGGHGWADVWKRHCFAWEYKSQYQDLDRAFVQLQRYALALENPPLLVVSDMKTIRVYTNFTNTVQEIHEISLSNLIHQDSRQLLKWVFTDPDRLKPGRTRTVVTREIAGQLAGLAQQLRERNHSPSQVAHFMSQLLFCLFAENANLFNGQAVLTAVLTACEHDFEHCADRLQCLLTTMHSGGYFGAMKIPCFNNGLFAEVNNLPLEKEDIQLLLKLVNQDWQAIEPSIFGTLFERGLDQDKRSQLGAHYTDPESILRLIDPVVLQPLRMEWQSTKDRITKMLGKSSRNRDKERAAHKIFNNFLSRLAQVRILDPACGSGNFLYLVLRGLQELEHQACLEFEFLFPESGKQSRTQTDTGPHNVWGIEVNPYAAELARVTVWIGHLQWLLTHGYRYNSYPSPPLQILTQDAILSSKGLETSWPSVDFIVGNPPFLGNKRMLAVLGKAYVERLYSVYRDRVPRGADWVTYWFEKARNMLENKQVKAVGLVATNSIRGGINRRVLDKIQKTGQIFEAWSDEEWVNEGASVRVSLVCFGERHEEVRLNGQVVPRIFSDLSATVDLTLAKKLAENRGVAFQGITKVGPFEIAGELARRWLVLPMNPNGRPNSDVLRPWANGKDITGRCSDTWIIDFGVMSEELASLYVAPFAYLINQVQASQKQLRSGSRQQKKWWLHGGSRPALRKALSSLSRYIGTVRVAKYRLFVWMDRQIMPDSAVVAIAREDDTFFGILHSRFHELWSLRLGTSLEDRPRYTPTTTFETFPFPEGLSPSFSAKNYVDNSQAQAIAAAAQCLHELRENWLNPTDWVKWVPEVVAGYPNRVIPVDNQAVEGLKKRTLTRLYNERPSWLVHAHGQLDEAVATAYGWPVDLRDEEVLRRLLELNLARALDGS